jgi:hypothetical protein
MMLDQFGRRGNSGALCWTAGPGAVCLATARRFASGARTSSEAQDGAGKGTPERGQPSPAKLDDSEPAERALMVVATHGALNGPDPLAVMPGPALLKQDPDPLESRHEPLQMG